MKNGGVYSILTLGCSDPSMYENALKPGSDVCGVKVVEPHNKTVKDKKDEKNNE